MLQHIPGADLRSKVLKNIAEVIKEDGEIFITVYNNNLINMLARLRRANNYATFANKEGYHKNGIYYYNFYCRELETILKKHFVIKEIIGCAPLIPKLTKYFIKYEGVSRMASIILEKAGLSHIVGKILMARCEKVVRK